MDIMPEQHQNLTTVAFQGDHYAFSEIAANTFFKNECRCFPNRTFEDVFAAVEKGFARYGIIPVENSLTGSIHRNYDLLLERHLHIVGETFLRIDHMLIANTGVALSDIRKIYSHPQALEQCRTFINSHSAVEAIPSFDTAGSVKMIKEQQMRNAAAIASRWAAQDHGMNILAEHIQDVAENYTRFLIISRQPDSLDAPNKTSVVFAMKNIAGALFKSLSVFALRDIDLCKIESRPTRNKPWEYIFYLDFSGHMGMTECRNAIRHLEEITTFIKVLGSYRSANDNAGELLLNDHNHPSL
jgi:prephenate dehydratase